MPGAGNSAAGASARDASRLPATWAPGPGSREQEFFEFGYYPVEPAEEGRRFLEAPLVVTQAHYHTFDLPEGAVRLAGNSEYPNQAFRYGENVYGFSSTLK